MENGIKSKRCISTLWFLVCRLLAWMLLWLFLEAKGILKTVTHNSWKGGQWRLIPTLYKQWVRLWAPLSDAIFFFFLFLFCFAVFMIRKIGKNVFWETDESANSVVHECKNKQHLQCMRLRICTWRCVQAYYLCVAPGIMSVDQMGTFSNQEGATKII